LRPGQPVIHASLASNPAIEYYIRVYVGHMVEPLNPIVHSGGSLSFRTSFDGSSDQVKKSFRGKRVWSSEDSNIVKIDQQSGEAKVVANSGSTTVYYKGAVYAFTQVRVEKVARIELDDNDDANPLVISGMLDKAGSQTSYSNKIHLAFFTASGERFTRPLSTSSTSNNRLQINHNFQVKCSIAERAWAKATAMTDPATGEVYCSVEPSTTLPLSSSAFPPDALTLKVTVSDAGSNYNTEETFHVKFVSRFVVVMDRTRNSPIRSIALNPTQTHKKVSVLFGSQTLSVAPLDPNLISVTSVAAGVYDIDVQNSARKQSFTTYIEFRDSSTGQRENVTVRYTTYGDPEKQPETVDGSEKNPKEYSDNSGLSNNPLAVVLFVLACVFVVISLVVYRNCGSDNTTTQDQNIQRYQSSSINPGSQYGTQARSLNARPGPWYN